jgi:hypothetical protein
MRRRAELESQIAALREANQRLEERVAIQDEALAECARAERSAETVKEARVAIDELLEVAGPALLAVARVLEARAAAMAIVQGSDIAEYQRLVRRAHEIRAAAGETPERYKAEAAVLYDELTEPLPGDSLAKRGLTRVTSQDE